MKDREKKFESYYTRIVAVMCITYAIIYCYFYIIGVDKPYLNAVVPTIGFNLSTWSLSFIKILWMKVNYNIEQQTDEPFVNEKSQV